MCMSYHVGTQNHLSYHVGTQNHRRLWPRTKACWNTMCTSSADSTSTRAASFQVSLVGTTCAQGQRYAFVHTYSVSCVLCHSPSLTLSPLQVTPDGRNCFSARIMWRPNGMGETYFYLPITRQQPHVCARCAFWPPRPSCRMLRSRDFCSWNRGAFTFPRGQWTKACCCYTAC
jgi:hypothetical protein